jgi:hypothetical protein
MNGLDKSLLWSVDVWHLALPDFSSRYRRVLQRPERALDPGVEGVRALLLLRGVNVPAVPPLMQSRYLYHAACGL